MEGKEDWRELCAQASVELDPKKLMKLVERITQLMDEERKEQIRKSPQAQKSPNAT